MHLLQQTALRGGAVLVVTDTAEHILVANGIVLATTFVSCRDLLTDALIRSRVVEIPDVRLEDPMQMSLDVTLLDATQGIDPVYIFAFAGSERQSCSVS